MTVQELRDFLRPLKGSREVFVSTHDFSYPLWSAEKSEVMNVVTLNLIKRDDT